MTLRDVATKSDKPPTVFVSYSRQDARHLKRLQVHLSALERVHAIDVWDDTRIAAGAHWREEIQSALARADIAVLLVSADFLASEFVTTVELPVLLAAENRRGMRVMMVLLSPCNLEVYRSLSQFAAVNDYAKPLSALSRHKCEEVWTRLSVEIQQSALLAERQQEDEWVRPPGFRIMVPVRKIPFVGREETLADIAKTLGRNGTARIVGLPGVGKTTIAAEYVYRHSDEIEWSVWLRAGDRTQFYSDLVRVSGALMGAAAPQSPSHVDRFFTWLRDQSGYLFVLDNVDDFDVVSPLLSSLTSHSVLVTTRISAPDERLPVAIPVPTMDSTTGASLLLESTVIGTEQEYSDVDASICARVAERVGGLPLALVQASATMEAASMTPAEYLELYDDRAAPLLGTAPDSDREASVARTFSVVLDRLSSNGPALAALRLLAFLEPDSVPDRIFTANDEWLDAGSGSQEAPQDAGRGALEALANYSLVERDAELQEVSCHRVVQDYVAASMTEVERQSWARSAVERMAEQFPIPEPQNIYTCYRLLPHAVRCAAHVREYDLRGGSAGWLLSRSGATLRQLGRYEEATVILEQAIAFAKRESDVKLLPWALHNYASLLRSKRELHRAERTIRRAIAVREASHIDRRDLAYYYHLLGSILRDRRKRPQAIAAYRKAAEVVRSEFGEDSPQLAYSLSGLANLCKSAGDYEAAEPLLQRALEVRTSARCHPLEIAWSQAELGDLYYTMADFQEASQMLRSALDARQTFLPPGHPDVTWTMNRLEASIQALDD